MKDFTAYHLTVGELECRQILLSIARGEDSLANARETVRVLQAKQRARRAELKRQERRLAALRKKGGAS